MSNIHFFAATVLLTFCISTSVSGVLGQTCGTASFSVASQGLQVTVKVSTTILQSFSDRVRYFRVSGKLVNINTGTRYIIANPGDLPLRNPRRRTYSDQWVITSDAGSIVVPKFVFIAKVPGATCYGAFRGSISITVNTGVSSSASSSFSMMTV